LISLQRSQFDPQFQVDGGVFVADFFSSEVRF